MIWLKDIIRPSILSLKAYSSARSLTYELDNSDSESTTTKSMDSKPTIYLDANESAYTPDLQTNLDWEKSLNRYPSPQPPSLLQKFSDIYKVDQNTILITRGSDEAIDVLTRAVCEPKTDSILIMPPTYGMYEVSADIQNTLTLQVPLLLKNPNLDSELMAPSSKKNVTNTDSYGLQQGWQIDLKSIEEKLKTEKNLKLVYICSPNNPTGTVFSKDDIKKILGLLPNQTLLVVDQAYCEFTPESSVIDLLKHYPQLVILRTLSKAWGLAGLRMGVLLGHPDLVSVLQKVRAPYPIPTPVIELTLKAISEDGFTDMQDRVVSTINEREFLKAELLKLESVVQIYPSGTNFLLVEFKHVPSVMQSMLVEKIILRDRSSQIKNTIRITVGSKLENENLMRCLKKINDSSTANEPLTHKPSRSL